MSIKFRKKIFEKIIKSASISADSIKNEVVAAVTQAILHASSNQIFNMGNFINILKEYGKNGQLSRILINIERDGHDSKVISLDVEGPGAAQAKQLINIASVQQAIEKYLTKNWEVYPDKRNDEKVTYDNFNFWVQYPLDGSDAGVAQR